MGTVSLSCLHDNTMTLKSNMRCASDVEDDESFLMFMLEEDEVDSDDVNQVIATQREKSLSSKAQYSKKKSDSQGELDIAPFLFLPNQDQFETLSLDAHGFLNTVCCDDGEDIDSFAGAAVDVLNEDANFQSFIHDQERLYESIEMDSELNPSIVDFLNGQMKSVLSEDSDDSPLIPDEQKSSVHALPVEEISLPLISDDQEFSVHALPVEEIPLVEDVFAHKDDAFSGRSFLSENQMNETSSVSIDSMAVFQSKGGLLKGGGSFCDEEDQASVAIMKSEAVDQEGFFHQKKSNSDAVIQKSNDVSSISLIDTHAAEDFQEMQNSVEAPLMHDRVVYLEPSDPDRDQSSSAEAIEVPYEGDQQPSSIEAVEVPYDTKDDYESVKDHGVHEESDSYAKSLHHQESDHVRRGLDSWNKPMYCHSFLQNVERRIGSSAVQSVLEPLAHRMLSFFEPVDSLDSIDERIFGGNIEKISTDSMRMFQSHGFEDDLSMFSSQNRADVAVGEGEGGLEQSITEEVEVSLEQPTMETIDSSFIVRETKGFQLRLYPESLGKVNVSVNFGGRSEVALVFTADNPEVTRIIQDSQNDLAVMLESVGYKVAKFDSRMNSLERKKVGDGKSFLSILSQRAYGNGLNGIKGGQYV